MRLRRILQVKGFEGSSTNLRKGDWQRAKIRLIVDFEGERHCGSQPWLSFCLLACSSLPANVEVRLIYKVEYPLELRALTDFSMWTLTYYIDSPPSYIPTKSAFYAFLRATC